MRFFSLRYKYPHVILLIIVIFSAITFGVTPNFAGTGQTTVIPIVKINSPQNGDKIAQGLFVRVDKMVWEEVDDLQGVSRGGFGSTDRKHNSNLHEKGSVHNVVRN